jgi:hypothetical protein
LDGSLEDHAVVVSQLDATHISERIEHHVYGRNSYLLAWWRAPGARRRYQPGSTWPLSPRLNAR